MDDLAARAIAGDAGAERELFEKLLVRFRQFAEPRVGADEAAEIAQAACITIYRKYREESFSVSFSAWAYGVFRNTLLKSNEKRQSDLRRFAELDSLPAPLPAPEESPRLEEFLRHCWRELITGFPRYARILNLRYQGFAIDEVCRKVQLSKEQYYVYLGRGRSMLKDCLEKRGISI